MKCYLINLDRSVDRLALMQQQMHALGLDLIRVPAVQVGQFSPDIASPALYAGEVACFLSHRKCWQLVARGEDEFAAIFEDDVQLSPNSHAFLSSTDWIPSNADLVKIETFMQPVFLRRKGARKAFDREVRILASWHAASAGYIISKKAAASLLESTNSYLEHPVDYLLFDWDLGILQNGGVYQLDPAICIQFDRLPSYDKPISPTIERREGSAAKRLKGNLTTTQKVRREIFRLMKRVYHFLSRRNGIICKINKVKMR